MIGLLHTARELRRRGVLGINERNAEVTLIHNRRELYPLVDDKVRTKRLALDAGIAVPELYAVIQTEHDARRVGELVRERRDFVVKPAQGSQGDGIVVVTSHAAGRYRVADGSILTEDELAFHVSNVLSGIYSLGGQPDTAIVEYRVRFDPVFESVTHRGVPDVRIIVFFGVPVMAMVRLPTRTSGGRANLHQGAIGAGVDIATGRTLTAVSGTSVVDEHPDTGNRVSGIVIPQWESMLDIAARSYELTGLGYQGIDIVLDRERGPMVLELNARPGLAIQIANRAGLRPRLDAVLHNRSSLSGIRARVEFARERFGRATGG